MELSAFAGHSLSSDEVSGYTNALSMRLVRGPRHAGVCTSSYVENLKSCPVRRMVSGPVKGDSSPGLGRCPSRAPERRVVVCRMKGFTEHADL